MKRSKMNTNRRFFSTVRNGAALQLLIGAAVLATLLGGWAIYYFKNRGAGEAFTQILTEVRWGEFVSQVLDQGEVQSSENVEIRCEVRARNGVLNVLKVVPEGSMVTEGDFLVQLDTTGFEKELEQQRVVMANAEIAKIQAETRVKTAEAERKEYIYGTYEEQKLLIVNEIADAEGQIQTANQNLMQAEAQYAHNKTLASKGFIVPQELQSSEFAIQNSKIQVMRGENLRMLAEKRLEVLENITKSRFLLQYDSEVQAAQVSLASQTEAYEVEQAKLQEIEKMMEMCTIRVPKGVSGTVVYATESSRSGSDWVLEEGGTVRENQVLVRLPNPKRMEVKALINEQSITQIQVGMPAKIKVDALNNRTLQGIVTKVNQYAEQSGWMSSNVRKYAAFVRIIEPPDELKPGMNASVSIQTQYEEKGLIAPIQSVYGLQDKQFCLVKVGDNRWETREVVTGGENAQYVLIKEGLKAGDLLVMNPGAYREYMDLPEVKLDNRIVLPEDEVEKVKQAAARLTNRDRSAEGPAAGNGGMAAGMGADFQIPASAAVLIREKDTNGDGKLSRDEIGSPFTFFFDRIDTDGDGLLSEAELDVSIRQMRQRRSSGGGGAPGGMAGDRATRPAPVDSNNVQ